MYKILIKYTSKFKKTFWMGYEKLSEDGTYTEFFTDDIEEIKKELLLLDLKYGYENLRVVKDVTYDITVELQESVNIGDVEITTSEDISNIYNVAYDKVFSDGGV